MSGVRTKLRDLDTRQFVRQFNFLGVEYRDIHQLSPIPELDVHALIAHAGFRKAQEFGRPTAVEADAHVISPGSSWVRWWFRVACPSGR